MFLLNILVYVIFALIMRSMANKSNLLHPASPKWDIYLRSMVGFYVLICALRWRVGVDNVAYVIIFTQGLSEDFSHSELLFYYLARVLSENDLHFAFGFAICALVQMHPIVKALREYKYILLTLPLVMFGSRYFLDMNNGVRQMMVTGMFVYASRYIVDRKPLRYLAFILIGTALHQSALMLVPFYFLPNWLHLAKMRTLMLGAFTACFIIGLTPAFQGLVGYVESVTGAFDYERYATSLTEMLEQGETDEALKFGPMMLSYLLTAYALIFFGPTLEKEYGKKIRYFNLWYNLSFFYACFYFLVCNVSHILIRPTMYFELFQMLMAALLLYDFGIRKKMFYWGFMLVLWVNICWNVVKITGSPGECVTYKVFFMHQNEVYKALRGL